MGSQSTMGGEGGCWTARSMDAPGDIVLDSPSSFSPSSPYPHSDSPSHTKVAPELCCLSHIHPSISPFPAHGTQWSLGYSGSLSIHEYRKHLCQPDHTAIPGKPRGRTLKRKAGTLNLNQTRTWADFSLPSSPVSSAPSSTPPLSFSQSLVSVISQHSDRDTANIFSPFSPSSLSNSRDLSLVSNRSATRRNQNTERQASFRDRLERTLVTQEAPAFSHRKSVSDSILIDIKKSNITVFHEGAAFEILNPRDSLRLSRIVSTPEETRRESSGSVEEKAPSVLVGKVRSSMSSDRTPSIRPANAPSEGTQRRTTPMRSLFDDLPTAYSHITGDYSPMLATSSSSMDISNPIISPLGNRGRKPHSDARQHHSADDQADEQMEKTEHVSNVDEQKIVHRRLSRSSSTSGKSMAGDFARLLLQRPKRAERAKDRLSNFFFPRSKLDHEERTRKRLSRSTEDYPLSLISQQQVGKRDADEPGHINALAESTSSLNLRQPNYHSARGRIDKSSTINEIVQQKCRRESISRSRERPITLFPDPFRHHFQASSPGPVSSESREFEIQNEMFSDNSGQKIDVRREARRNLVGDEPAAPLPSIYGRLESQRDVQNAENLHLDNSTSTQHSFERNGNDDPELLENSEPENPRENTRQVTGAGLSALQPKVVSHPLAEDTRRSGTFIPYASSTGTLGAYVSGQFRSLSRSTHGPDSAVSVRQTLPSNIEENANEKTCKGNVVGSGKDKEASHSANYSPYAHPYESQSSANDSQVDRHGTFETSLSQVQDLGPGGSQSSSSQQLSEPFLSPLLRPHLRLLSGLRSLRSRTISHGGVSNNYSRLRHSRHVFRSGESEAAQDDEQDWETIAESEQFSTNTFDTFVGQGAHRSGYADPYTPRLGQAMTGSSLADYSSHGSLAQEGTSSWTPFDLPSSPPLPQSSHFFHPHDSGQENIHQPYYESDAEPSAYYVLNTDASLNTNALAAQVPPLTATTSHLQGPPRPHSARTYRHPTPLGGSHTNPFHSSPPSILRGADVCPGRLDSASGQASRVGGANHHSKFSFLEYSDITEEDTDLQTSYETPGNIPTHPDGQPLPSRTPSLDTSPLHRTPSDASSGWVTIRSTHENPATFDIPYRDQLLTKTSRSRPGRHGRLGYPPSHERRVTDASSNDAGNAPAGVPLNQAAVQSSSTEQLGPGPSGKPTPVRSTPGSLYQSIRARYEKGQNQRLGSNDIELQQWPQRSFGSRNGVEAPHGQGKGADIATTFPRSSLKHGASTAALLAASERSRTTLNSAAGTSASRTKRYRTDAEVRERLRILDNLSVADIARPRTAMTFPSSSRLAGDEESAGSYLPWHRSSSGRYVFTEPPRLMQLPPRYSQASIMSNIDIQKRQGRRLLAGLTLLFPFGWAVVALIGLGVSWPDRLIKWCSGGLVESFHDRERILARWMILGYILVLMGAMISLFMALFSR